MAAHDSPIRSVLARFARVIHSATELVILQFQLTQQDAALAGSKIKPAFIATACAVGLLLSGFPLLSFGLAGALAYGTNLPVWVAQLIVAVLFLALGSDSCSSPSGPSYTRVSHLRPVAEKRLKTCDGFAVLSMNHFTNITIRDDRLAY